MQALALAERTGTARVVDAGETASRSRRGDLGRDRLADLVMEDDAIEGGSTQVLAQGLPPRLRTTVDLGALIRGDAEAKNPAAIHVAHDTPVTQDSVAREGFVAHP